MKDILIQDLNSKKSAFGQIKIDHTSIIIKRDLEHTYHSESYVKEAMNETTVSNNQKAVTSTIAKDKTLQTRVGVVRKTTVKPNPSSKKKNAHSSDEPDIDTENLPVIQGTFQITKTEADITENKQTEGQVHQEEKATQKPSSTTKLSTTRKAFISTTTPKPKPFTITSTFNVKTRTEPTPKNNNDTTTKNTITTISTTMVPTTSPLVTTTSNISQILLELLSNENHNKDLPKIDTLFTVPHVIDNEPWRPITRPFDETSPIEELKITTPLTSEVNAEDRIGVAEVVDDISIIESIMSPIPPSKNRFNNKEKSKVTLKPPGVYNVDPSLAAEVYVPGPVYTSFTLPTFAPPLKDMETLGASYPKPHPLPVDKIGTIVEIQEKNKSDDDNDGKPVERPPKDKTTSVSINVLTSNYPENNTEKISIDGTSILKAHNDTVITQDIKNDTVIESNITTTTEYNLDKELTTELTTKRMNDKVSIIPSTNVPHFTWELVNTTTKENDTFTKHSPEKYYNDTLQAIITKNDSPFPITTPKFPNKISILRNLTDIIKKYAHSTTEKTTISDVDAKASKSDIIAEENPEEITGTAEVEVEEGESTTISRVITLLPAKSNLGVNRPLRPKPRPNVEQKEENSTDDQRRFFKINTKSQNLQEYSNEKTYVPIIIDTTEHSIGEKYINSKENETKTSDSLPSNSRLPKSNFDISDSNVEASNVIFNKSKVLPDGTYRVSYHVTGSVSSKQANKTKPLPAYELSLEPDVILEIPVNETNLLTVDKLKQLASLATISDSNNNTLFRTQNGIISTKAIPSSYTLNQAGFKILTKTYNKLSSSKLEDKKYNKISIDKSQDKPVYEVNIDDDVKEITPKEGKNISIIK